MKSNVYKNLIVFVLLVLSNYKIVDAQITLPNTTDKKVYVSQTFLLKPINPIAAALGNLKIAAPPSSSSVYYNPSGVLLNDEIGSGANINYAPLTNSSTISNVYNISAGGFYRFDINNLVTGAIKFNNFGKINLITETFQDYGVSNPFDIAADIGFAHKIHPNISLSLTARYIHNSYNASTQIYNGNIEIISGQSVAADINLSYLKTYKKNNNEIRLNVGFLNLGANLGSRYSYAFQPFMPASMGIGGSYKHVINLDMVLSYFVEFNKMLVPLLYRDSVTGKINSEYLTPVILKSYLISMVDNTDGLMGELSEISTSLGVQMYYAQKFFFRIGYYKDAKTLSNAHTIGAGAGLRFLDNFEINLSFNTYLSSNDYVLASLNNNAIRFGITYQNFENFFDAQKARIKGRL